MESSGNEINYIAGTQPEIVIPNTVAIYSNDGGLSSNILNVNKDGISSGNDVQNAFVLSSEMTGSKPVEIGKGVGTEMKIESIAEGSNIPLATMIASLDAVIPSSFNSKFIFKTKEKSNANIVNTVELNNKQFVLSSNDAKYKIGENELLLVDTLGASVKTASSLTKLGILNNLNVKNGDFETTGNIFKTSRFLLGENEVLSNATELNVMSGITTTGT